MRVLSLFQHNHSSLELFGLFLQEVQAKKAAKTAQKVPGNYGCGETKRETMAVNSNREQFLNCVSLIPTSCYVVLEDPKNVLHNNNTELECNFLVFEWPLLFYYTVHYM